MPISIEKGEIFSLLGPNGAGKSICIKWPTTILKPSSGNAFVDGVSIVVQLFGARGLIGYVNDIRRWHPDWV